MQVNLSSFFAIHHTSSLTFKVAGCLKNVGVVMWGVLSGDHFTALQGLSYAISMGGFGLYTYKRTARPSHQVRPPLAKQV